jgi:hypothetical protein
MIINGGYLRKNPTISYRWLGRSQRLSRGDLELEAVMVVCGALRHFGVLMSALFSQRVKITIASFDQFSS